MGYFSSKNGGASYGFFQSSQVAPTFQLAPCLFRQLESWRYFTRHFNTFFTVYQLKTYYKILAKVGFYFSMVIVEMAREVLNRNKGFFPLVCQQTKPANQKYVI